MGRSGAKVRETIVEHRDRCVGCPGRAQSGCSGTSLCGRTEEQGWKGREGPDDGQIANVSCYLGYFLLTRTGYQNRKIATGLARLRLWDRG